MSKHSKIDKLKEILKLIPDGYLTHADGKHLIDTFVSALNDCRRSLTETVAYNKGVMSSEVQDALKQLSVAEAKLRGLVAGTKKNVLTELERTTQQLLSDIKRVEEMIEPAADLTPLREMIQAVAASIPVIPAPMSADEIRNRLEVLSDDERLDKKAIKGIEDIERRIDNISIQPTGTAPSRGMFLYINGVKRGLLNSLNLVPGSNMAISYSKENGQDTLTFTSSGGGSGGITVETPPETPDGTITDFTASDEPQWVVADGITYYAGAGYTYSAPTVTMDVPPSATIRIII